MTTIQRSETLATLGRRHDSDLRDRIADGGARRLPGGSSLDVDASVVVLDLQALARQRLS
ncbi:MAG: hypothetical protein E6G37_05375 [Actinobacteria bacterium]|nr:MAG: hypothetical protein E6G63_00265 [Actinomycetota bacterium]TMK21901.1 MAG: hypothetical protein E6G65_03940 [Actinomycetota bacterium]TMK93799.1 MAG: hypothetical protein E6G37_05375 [Actinomycetota bacterium]TMM23366.1 MAG: hypothetical protein E6F95_06010 [Actinomycetota bacterium]